MFKLASERCFPLMPLCTPFGLLGEMRSESTDLLLVPVPLRPSSSDVWEVEASEEDLECAMRVCRVVVALQTRSEVVSIHKRKRHGR